MDRAERRSRTEKIAEKRFRQLYCDYHGTPNAWFYRRYDEEERAKAKGKCRNRRDSWRCRCDYCLGGLILKQGVADQNFREQLEDAANLSMPLPNVQDAGSVGPYDWGHELWELDVCPWRGFWSCGDSFHHPKKKIKNNGKG